jgi:hypothetical protein
VLFARGGCKHRRPSVRTLATLEAALRANGADLAEEYIAAFREIRTMTFLPATSRSRQRSGGNPSVLICAYDSGGWQTSLRRK